MPKNPWQILAFVALIFVGGLVAFFQAVGNSNSNGASGNGGNIPAAPTPTPGTGSLTESITPENWLVNLTTQTSAGGSDWIKWGYGGSATAVDRKASGGSKISTFTQNGTGTISAGTALGTQASWTDGTPDGTVSNNTAQVQTTGGVGNGFSITVPSSTSVQTLQVLVGDYCENMSMTVTPQDGSFAAVTDQSLKDSGSGANAVVNMQYATATTSSITVSFQVVSDACSGGGFGIVAAWITPGTQAVPGVVPTPTPAPTPTPPGGCPDITTFDNVSSPNSCYTPYAGTSVWNLPLPANPALLSNSQAVVNFYFGNYNKAMGANAVTYPFPSNMRQDYAYPYYYGNASDPLVTIQCTGYLGNACSNASGNGTVQFHIPAFAADEQSGGSGTDAHMTVIDVPTHTEYNFYQWASNPPYTNGGTVKANAGNRGDVNTGNGFWSCSGATAGCNGLEGGVVRISELQAGVIHHKLAGAPPCTAFGSHVYPEQGGVGQSCSVGGATTNNTIPIGSVFWWDETPSQVAARTNLTAAARTVLNAMHAYGVIVTDTNGNNGSFSITSTPESQTRYIRYPGNVGGTFDNSNDIVGQYAKNNFKDYGQSYLYPPSHTYKIDLDQVSNADILTHLHVVQVCVQQQTC